MRVNLDVPKISFQTDNPEIKYKKPKKLKTPVSVEDILLDKITKLEKKIKDLENKSK